MNPSVGLSYGLVHGRKRLREGPRKHRPRGQHGVGQIMCQQDRAGVTIMSVEHHLDYHSHHAMMWGHPGNIMKIKFRVTSSSDGKCPVGTSGRVTLYASYNGVRSDASSSTFRLPAWISAASITEHKSITRSRRCRLRYERSDVVATPRPAPPRYGEARSFTVFPAGYKTQSLAAGLTPSYRAPANGRIAWPNAGAVRANHRATGVRLQGFRPSAHWISG